MKKLIYYVAVCLIVLVSGASKLLFNGFSSEPNKLSVSNYNDRNFEAPDFSLPDLNGNVISLKELRGNYVVIHIATTWCPFCNAEAPNLEKLYQDYKALGVKVLIIDVKEPEALVKKKLKDKFNLSFPVLMDSDGSVSASYAPVGVLPDLDRDEVMIASNLLIDPEGRIQFMSLLDTRNFDAKLIDLKSKLDELLNK